MNKNKLKNIMIIILLVLLVFSRFRPTIDFGLCYNNNGDGVLLNRNDLMPIDEYYNYIGYDNNLMGKYIYTLCIYNPLNNYCDDIILRYDYVSRETYKLNYDVLKYTH